jgi:hypothetical protein
MWNDRTVTILAQRRKGEAFSRFLGGFARDLLPPHVQSRKA